MFKLCKAIHEFESPNVAFNGDASRLFLISCCKVAQPNMKLTDAVLVLEEASVNISESYNRAAADENEKNVIDSYFATSFENLRVFGTVNITTTCTFFYCLNNIPCCF
jgi:hypothetical protein